MKVFCARVAVAMLLVSMIAATQPAWAVKANPNPVTYYQPDGSSFQAKMIGDERIVFVEDLDGNTLVKDESGWWMYADPASHKADKLRPSKLRAGKEKPAKESAKHVRPAIDATRLPGPPRDQQDDGSIRELFKKSATQNARTGRFGIATEAVALTPTTVPVLAILVEFSDWKHTSGPNTPVAGEPGFEPIPGQPNTAPTWQTLFGDPNVPGGLNHFYKEATYGRMQWDVKVAQRGKGQAGTGTLVNDGWYANPNTMAYWGAARTGTFGACDEDRGSSTNGIKDLITWAVQQANADVDFSVYDKDGNGSISDAELMIFVIHAREGQEYYGSGCDASDPLNNHIWSHKWNMAVNVAVDGKTIPTGHIYAIEPEFNPEFDFSTSPWSVTDKFFGVGVYAHEALHTLGAPDIYDTGYDATPAGEWDLMDSGSYNGARSGTHPAHMGGPLKQDIKLNADTDANSYGFILESEIREPVDGSWFITPTGTNSADNTLHRFRAPNNANEWFLIENRSPVGYYERYLPEHGLLIWHRDRSVAGSGNNAYPYQTNVLRKGWANTAAGLQTSVLKAAFSANDGEATFTATTDPHNKLNNGTASGLKDIRCISAESSAMGYAYGTVAGAQVQFAGTRISGGDGDQWLDAAEAAQLSVRVTNSACAGAAASNVTVTLGSSIATVGAAVPSTVVTIAAGQTVDVTFPVTLSCTACTTAAFNYSITSGTTTFSGVFEVEANQSRLWFDDADANANPGWSSQTGFVPSACTSAVRHGDWTLTAHPTAPHGNSYRAPVGTNGLTFPSPDEVWMTPNINVPAGTDLRELRFSLAAEIPCLNYTRGRLWVSTDGGVTWTRHEGFYKDAGDLSWEEIRVSLAQFSGASQLRFMFAIYTYTCPTGCTATRGMYVDDIAVVTGDQLIAADTIAPVIAITAPTAGATLTGTASVNVTATDNKGVTKVELYVDGTLAATDTAAPFSFSWNSGTVANGTHVLTTKAYDAAGNVGTSAGVSITTNNDVTAPVISNVTSVKTNTRGAFEIRWTTNEPSNSVVTIGTTNYTSATMVTSHVIAISGKKGTTYTYTVKSTDAAGNTATAGPFTHVN
jgi:M6 family metalloprotease-like protein